MFSLWHSHEPGDIFQTDGVLLTVDEGGAGNSSSEFQYSTLIHQLL